MSPLPRRSPKRLPTPKKEKKKMKSKKHPKPLMHVDVRVLGRLRTNPNVYSLEIVPISQIELRKPWNKFRLKDNLAKIKTTKAMPPVWLHFDEKLLRFQVEDGIHRINVAKQLGFTHVPAIVAREKRKR